MKVRILHNLAGCKFMDMEPLIYRINGASYREFKGLAVIYLKHSMLVAGTLMNVPAILDAAGTFKRLLNLLIKHGVPVIGSECFEGVGKHFQCASHQSQALF